MLGKKTALGAFVLVLAYYTNKYFNFKIPGDIVTIKNGKIQGALGYSRNGRLYTEWLGIPYAKPPVGELRFTTPQPVDDWEGVREGSNYGSRCPQIELVPKTFTGNEDCLFLNVHTPIVGSQERRKQALLPVMIFIHGGYFENGGGDMYRPGYFMDEDVVLVTLNYRLGVLGFLSTGDGVIRGNMGLKDQSLAIRWVKENIQYFGGDPEQITIFGESAGSVSVHMQLLSPMTNGLVTRAISQSGSAFSHWAIYEDPAGQAKEFAQRVNCDDPSKDEVAKCLRGLEAATLVDALQKGPLRTKKHIFVPVIEGVDDKEAFLSKSPEELNKSGRVSRVPWLTGVNSAEGLLSVSTFARNATLGKVVEENWSVFEDLYLFPDAKLRRHSQEIREFYFGRKTGINPSENIESAAKLVSDRNYFSVITKAIDAHKEYAPVYPYWYDKEGPSVLDLLIHMKGKFPGSIDAIFAFAQMWMNRILKTPSPFKGVGVAHADDLAMLFEVPPIFKIKPSSEYYEFSKDIVKAWAGFASGKLPKFKGENFPRIEKSTPVKFLKIDDTPKVIDFPHPERLTFWNKLRMT